MLIGDCDDGVLQSRGVEENDVLWRYAADTIARQDGDTLRVEIGREPAWRSRAVAGGRLTARAL